MLKNLVTELAVLIGFVFGIFLLVPMLMYPFRIDVRSAPLPFIIFIVCLSMGIFHLNRLVNEGKTKRVIAFTALLIATIIISSITFWILFQPELM